MENTSLIALSSLMALGRQTDVVANNIANVNTAGYRAERVLFQEFLADVGADQPASFVLDLAVAHDLSPGAILPTDNPLDVAIEGSGYFVVETDQGLRYTRNGHFKLDAQSRIVTAQGDPVLEGSGQAITVPPGAQSITVSRDGVVSAGADEIGRFDVVAFESEQELRKTGQGYYRAEGIPTPADDVAIHQGTIETSNVDPIVEITRLMEISRRYQSIQRMIDRGDELRRRAIDRLGASA